MSDVELEMPQKPKPPIRSWGAARTEIERRVFSERIRQYQKWGEQRHDPLRWLAITAEEFGEVAKEIVELEVPFGVGPEARELRRRAAIKELIELAASASAFAQCLETGFA